MNRFVRRTAVPVLSIITISALLLYWKMMKTDSDMLSGVLRRKVNYLLNVHQMEFEPEVLEDIQTIDSQAPRIPHILHFIFISGLKGQAGIPALYRDNVNSFFHLNPNWTYYFWTDKSARQLIESRQPALLPTWDNYRHVINKADALRYVLLYEFGGVYADLDMKCFRPLNRATIKYSCMLTPEPFEHSAIIMKTPFVLSTAFMMCRSKHPLMKEAIASLPEFAEKLNALVVAGPIFLTTIFKRYNKFQPGDEIRMKTDFRSNSPYFYKGTLPETNDNAVYIANTHYFMSSFDARANFQKVCNGTQRQLVKRGCFLWEKRRSMTTESMYSYTDHSWAHIYSFNNSTRMIPITRAIPRSNLKIWQSENQET